MEEDPACSYDTESSSDAERAVKQEFDVDPTVLQTTDLHYVMMEPKFETSSEESSHIHRRQRTRTSQQEALVHLLSRDRELALGRVVAQQGRITSDRRWEAITARLNSMGPAKTSKQWQRVWSDLRKKTRNTLATAVTTRRRTGDTAMPPALTALEHRVVSILYADEDVERDVLESDDMVVVNDVELEEIMWPVSIGEICASTSPPPPALAHRDGWEVLPASQRGLSVSAIVTTDSREDSNSASQPELVQVMEGTALPTHATERELLRNATSERELVRNATSERELVRNAASERELVRNATSERELVRNATSERELVRNVTSERKLVRNATSDRELARNATSDSERDLLRNSTPERRPRNRTPEQQERLAARRRRVAAGEAPRHQRPQNNDDDVGGQGTGHKIAEDQHVFADIAIRQNEILAQIIEQQFRLEKQRLQLEERRLLIEERRVLLEERQLAMQDRQLQLGQAVVDTVREVFNHFKSK